MCVHPVNIPRNNDNPKSFKISPIRENVDWDSKSTFTAPQHYFLGPCLEHSHESLLIKHVFCSCISAVKCLEIRLTARPLGPKAPAGPTAPAGPCNRNRGRMSRVSIIPNEGSVLNISLQKAIIHILQRYIHDGQMLVLCQSKQVRSYQLTGSPRFPGLPEGPTCPWGPGAPRAPLGPGLPGAPRSPWEQRNAKGEAVCYYWLTHTGIFIPWLLSQRKEKVTLKPGAPSRPGGPSFPGLPC